MTANRRNDPDFRSALDAHGSAREDMDKIERLLADKLHSVEQMSPEDPHALEHLKAAATHIRAALDALR